MKYLLLLTTLVLGFAGFAQPENAQIEMVNGKRYYVHFVQAGNTLYGIHNLYKVPVEDIVAANPEVATGLKDGQRLLIPVKGAASLPENLIIHQVQTKETLYGISKKYDVSIERLMELNPGVEQGLNEGQELKIPVKTNVENSGAPLETKQKDIKVSFSDTIINHEVQKGETLYSISKRFMVTENDLRKINKLKNDKLRPGDILKIPIKKEKVEKVKVRAVEPFNKKQKVDSTILFKKKDSYNVAILMPLFFEKTENTPANVSEMAAEFYMGAKLALDSLEKMGFKANVYAYDSQSELLTVKDILAKKESQNLDMFIGPFYGNNATQVADFAKQNGIRMVCPFATNYEILRDNPLVYEAVSSDVTLAEGLAKYILKTHTKEQVLLIKPKNEKDILEYQAFREAYLNTPLLSGTRLKLIETTVDDFATFLKLNTKIHIVCLASDKTTAIAMMNSVNRSSMKASNSAITLYGTKEWVNFDELSSKYKNKFNFHYASPFDLNYKNEQMKAVHRLYRREYNADMTKMAIQGFDITMYFCSTMLLKKPPKKGVMNNVFMTQRGEGNGFENTNCFIVRHQEFEYIKVAEIHD